MSSRAGPRFHLPRRRASSPHALPSSRHMAGRLRPRQTLTVTWARVNVSCWGFHQLREPRSHMGQATEGPNVPERKHREKVSRVQESQLASFSPPAAAPLFVASWPATWWSLLPKALTSEPEMPQIRSVLGTGHLQHSVARDTSAPPASGKLRPPAVPALRQFYAVALVLFCPKSAPLAEPTPANGGLAEKRTEELSERDWCLGISCVSFPWEASRQEPRAKELPAAKRRALLACGRV